MLISALHGGPIWLTFFSSRALTVDDMCFLFLTESIIPCERHAQLVEFMSFDDIIKVIIKQKITEGNIFYVVPVLTWISEFIFINLFL